MPLRLLAGFASSVFVVFVSLPALAQFMEIDCSQANVEETIAKANPGIPARMIANLVKTACPNGTGAAAAAPRKGSITWSSESCFPKDDIGRKLDEYRMPRTPELIADITAACAKVTEPQPIDPQRSHVGPVEVSRLLPGGRFAVSGGRDRTLRLWDIHADTAPRVIHTAKDTILRLAVSPDGRRAVVAGFGDRPAVIELPSGRVVATLEGNLKFVAAAAFFPDGSRLLASASDNEVGIFDAATGKLLRKYPAFRFDAAVLAISPDGRLAAVGTAGGDLRVFFVEAGQQVMIGQQPSPSALVFEPGSRRLVVGAREKFDIHDLTTGKFTSLAFRPGTGHRGVGAAFLPPKDRLLTCSRDLQEWDIASGKLVRDIMTFPFQCTALSLSEDGRAALVSHDDSDMRLIDIESGRLIRQLGQTGPKSVKLEIPLR